MKAAPLILIGAITSLASAQLSFNDTTGTFGCGAHPNGTYCAGANIIVRCSNGVGQPGNCNDNLAGSPPLGVNYSPCFQCDETSGRAACSKNGIVYPGSGTGLGSVPFPSNDTSICSATVPGNGTSSVTPTGGVPTATGGQPTGYPTTPVSPPIPSFTGAATSVQVMGLVGFGALFAALGMV